LGSHAINTADEDSMRADLLLHQQAAVENGLRAFENRAAGAERAPLRAGEALLARLPGPPRKAIGDVRLVRGQQVDAKNAAARNDRRQASGPVETDEKRRRLGRDRADRADRASRRAA